MASLHAWRAKRFESLIEYWEQPLFYYIRRLVQSEEDAWDVLQEVWFVAVKELSRIRDPQCIPAWLFRIARNTSVSHYRKTSRMQPFDEEGPGSESEAADETITFDAADAIDIHKALTRLSIPHREVLTLYFLEEFSLAEIAEITGVQLGTVKSRMHYAKRALREELEKEETHHDS